MENMSARPSDPAEELAAAEVARRRLTSTLRLPSWFHSSLGVAIAVQIATAAYGVAEQSGAALAVLAAGCLVFLAVAGVQVTRFRRLNGVRVDGLVSRAVLGTSTWSVMAESAGLAGAVWAAFEGQPWLAAAAAVAGGAAYAASSHLWWRRYQTDPTGHAQAESLTTLVLLGCVAVAGLVALLLAR
jgi:nitrate reductase gamma subunit